MEWHAKTVLVAGRFSMKKAELETLLRRCGAEITTKLLDADVLVAGDRPGKRLDEAERLGVPIVSEEMLLASVEDVETPTGEPADELADELADEPEDEPADEPTDAVDDAGEESSRTDEASAGGAGDARACAPVVVQDAEADEEARAEPFDVEVADEAPGEDDHAGTAEGVQPDEARVDEAEHGEEEEAVGGEMIGAVVGVTEERVAPALIDVVDVVDEPAALVWRRVTREEALETGWFAAVERALAEHPEALEVESGQLGVEELGALFAAASGLRGLALPNAALSPEGLRVLLESGALDAMHTLTLRGCRIGDAGVRVLAAHAPKSLRVLDLTYAGLTDAGLEALLAAPCAARLTTLKLATNTLTVEGVRAFAKAPARETLRALDLANMSLGAEELSALLAPRWPLLHTLNLSDCGPGDAGVLVLADRAPETLRELCLREEVFGTPFTDEGALALATSARLAGLRALDVSGAALSARGVNALLSSPVLRALEVFQACGQRVSLDTLALDAAPGSLRVLQLDDARGEQDTGATLRDAAFSRLEVLTLTRCALPEQALLALLENPTLRSGALRLLDLAHNDLSPAVIERLGRLALPGLEALDLCGFPMEPEDVVDLRDAPWTTTLRTLTISQTTAEVLDALAAQPYALTVC